MAKKLQPNNDFLPQNYSIPTPPSSYCKFGVGDTQFRILSSPIIGWIDWTRENKPVRFRMDKKPETSLRPDKPVEHFWAFIVWNKEVNAIQIAEVTQASIQKGIKKYADDKSWGDPKRFDLKVTRTGTSRNDTVYSIIALPPSPVSKEIKDMLAAKKINLEVLFDGGDPFVK